MAMNLKQWVELVRTRVYSLTSVPEHCLDAETSSQSSLSVVTDCLQAALVRA